MVGERKSRLVPILIAIIVILGLVMIYAFIIRPSINGYATKLQNQGIALTIQAILSQIQQNGMVQIPISANQSITLYSQTIIPQLCSQLNSNTATK